MIRTLAIVAVLFGLGSAPRRDLRGGAWQVADVICRSWDTRLILYVAVPDRVAMCATVDDLEAMARDINRRLNNVVVAYFYCDNEMVWPWECERDVWATVEFDKENRKLILSIHKDASDLLWEWRVRGHQVPCWQEDAERAM